MVKIIITDADALKDKGCYERIYGMLDEERKKKADCIRNEEKKRQSVAAGWLLCQAEKRFSPEADGVGKQAPCFTNLSHSGSLAACIMSDGEIGIDLEIVRTVRKNVLEKCFTDRERERLFRAGSEKERAELFTELWTEKESAAKLTGEGISRIIRRGTEEEEKGIHKKTFRIPHKEEVYYMTAAYYSGTAPSEYEWLDICVDDVSSDGTGKDVYDEK